MTATSVLELIESLPNNVCEYIIQDLERWSELLNYRGLNAFENFYKTRQEFRSLIRYRIRTAQSKFDFPDLTNRYLKLHKPNSSAWVNSLFISCNDIGKGFYIEHGFSSIVYAKSIGRNFYLNQNVTIGTAKYGNPSLGDNVRVGANSVIIGGIHVSDHVTVGAGAVLNFEVPEGSTVVAQKARVIKPAKANDNGQTFC